MLKIRKVIDFFYRFRFVFIGAAVVTAATITTLDLTKGSITEVSKFEVSYNYGDPISCSGTAFMGNVTFEFRRKGDKEWTEEEPYLAGEYEARGKSQGSHGYKYTDVSTFEIKPLDFTLNILNSSIDFGDDSPDLAYDPTTLAKGDKLLNDDVRVTYANLEERTTTANINMDTVKIVNSSGKDVTSCYQITTEKDKEVTFNQETLKIDFKTTSPYSYTGEIFSNNEYDVKSGSLYYGAHLEMSGGKSGSAIGVYDNTGEHSFKVVDDQGHDYTKNYNIKIGENSFEIEAAPAVTITSTSLTKTYNGETFEEFADPDSLITISPGLIRGHHFKLIDFTNKNIYRATSGNIDNSFTFDIVDDNGDSVDRTLYKSITPRFGTLKINKQAITIVSKSTTDVFDNRYHSIPEYETPVNGLADGDGIYIDEAACTKQLGPTSSNGVNNQLSYVIKRGGESGEDVTDCYSISNVYGKIVVNQMKLKFNFETFPVTYDGQEHPYYRANGNYSIYDTTEKRNNAAVLADGYSLPSGWTYNVRLNGSFVRKNVTTNGYKATANDVAIEIWDNSEPSINVASYFTIGTDITFDFPIATVSPKPLEITVKDYNKTFDNQSIANDIVINPNDPSTCVEYNGLVDGDLPDVDFLPISSSAAQNNKDASDTPYVISLSYGVKNSSGSNLTNNYDITFKNNKQTINASIAKKDINIIPTNVYKYYNGSKEFVPNNPTCEAISTPLIGEQVFFKDNASKYETTNSTIGTYSYDLKKSDIVIKVGGQDVTSNYNIFFKKSGSVEIEKRGLNILSTSNSTSGSYIFFDNNDHGAFTTGDGCKYVTEEVSSVIGQSFEINIETYNNDDTRGLVPGQRLVINDPDSDFKRKNPGYLNIASSSSNDLNITIYDSDNNPVTTNYSITHDSFDIHIVKPKIYIYPQTISKFFDGSYFELSGLENVPFIEDLPPSNQDNAYRNYNSTEMSKLYGCDFTYDLDDGYGERDYKSYMTQRGHTLKLTKYSKDDANNAKYYYPENAPLDIYGNPENYNLYPFNYSYKVFDGSGNDVTNLYDFYAPQGIDNKNLLVRQASLSVSCTGDSQIYNSQVCSKPDDQYPLTNDQNASAYIASSEEVGPKFNDNYKLRAAFDTSAYTPEQIAAMYSIGTYNFGVTITIQDINNNMSYAMDGFPSISINILKNYYGYEIVKRDISIKTTKVLPDGRSIRSCSGLAGDDKLYFYDAYGEEELVAGLYVYTKPFNYVKIKRNGVDVTSCYKLPAGFNE